MHAVMTDANVVVESACHRCQQLAVYPPLLLLTLKQILQYLRVVSPPRCYTNAGYGWYPYPFAFLIPCLPCFPLSTSNGSHYYGHRSLTAIHHRRWGYFLLFYSPILVQLISATDLARYLLFACYQSIWFPEKMAVLALLSDAPSIHFSDF